MIHDLKNDDGPRRQRRAVFLDRDGVLIQDSPDYITTLEQITLLPNVATSVKQLNDAGFRVIVVTNQSAIARGLLTEALLGDMHNRLQERLLREAGAVLDGIYYCPFHPDGSNAKYRRHSDLRKPEPGMLLQAAEEHDIDLPRSFMIGDKALDIVAGTKAGCRTVLLQADPDREECATSQSVRPTYVAPDLAEAVRWILSSVVLPD